MTSRHRADAYCPVCGGTCRDPEACLVAGRERSDAAPDRSRFALWALDLAGRVEIGSRLHHERTRRCPIPSN
jgi:hypothetical protein